MRKLCDTCARDLIADTLWMISAPPATVDTVHVSTWAPTAPRSPHQSKQSDKKNQQQAHADLH